MAGSARWGVVLLLGLSSPCSAEAVAGDAESSRSSWQAIESDLAPEGGPLIPIFDNGFEAGNACAWLGACAPNLRINEINANITSGCDLVELRVLAGGNLQNFSLDDRDAALLTFESVVVQTGDLVVVHVNGGGGGPCNPDGCPDETVSQNQFPTASCLENYDTAWDWHSTDSGLASTSNVLTLYRPDGSIVDAVLLVDSAASSTVATVSETQAAIVAAAGEWENIGGGTPPGGYVDVDFSANAVNSLIGSSTNASGTSIQRLDDQDANDKNDWTTGSGQASTFGLPNGGQSDP